MITKNTLFIAVTLICLTSSCTPKTDSETKKSVVAKTINSFYQSFEQKDINLMSEVMAHDDSMLSFGTAMFDIHKSWSEWKENHIAQFKAFDRATINPTNLNVYLSKNGNVAWFADITNWALVIENETIEIDNVRITGVLEKRDHEWKIVQIHASVPQG
ncbi:nuclear transport factor 2 family protein [Zhouia amylolytica]|uniref:SnoaL-like domain-containing protein n=1 Tax=Zhouia amylolytica AD3 TaxID=1286632 RepID=W2URT6_9FLAO|nr:nuclear transport factor 2 family protein [Zhouia amylolytica]ETN96669.1 hypothetical protein P278_00950 [Zhouia amylolytica AD3]